MTEKEAQDIVDAAPPAWDKVVSPRVWDLTLSMVGKPIDPISFGETMKVMRHSLSLTEQIEFALLMQVFAKAHAV